jgi:hypothetical protein
MKNDFILIYKSNGFAESKEVEFELRNAFKKYELHASYMTKRKFKTMAKVDPIYKSLSDIHHQLSYSAFVLFVHPTEECTYKKPHEISTLISLLKKEATIQNEDTYFVGVVINDTCVSQEQLDNLYIFNKELDKTNVREWLSNSISSPISILNYNINNYIVSIATQQDEIVKSNIINTLTTKYIYI